MIKVTVIGYSQLCQFCTHFPWDFGASKNCAITFWRRCWGSSSQFSSKDTFSASLYPKSFTSQILHGDSTEGDPLTFFDNLLNIVWRVDTERGVNQYQVQFKTFFNL
jgi:hypothetical protein